MSTSFLDTGEQFLSPDEKRYARVELIPQHIEHEPDFRMAPTITALVAILGVAALTLAVFAL